jgi:hypothetical protein
MDELINSFGIQLPFAEEGFLQELLDQVNRDGEGPEGAFLDQIINRPEGVSVFEAIRLALQERAEDFFGSGFLGQWLDGTVFTENTCLTEEGASKSCNTLFGQEGNFVCRKLANPFNGNEIEITARTICVPQGRPLLQNVDTCGCCDDEC